MTSPKSSVDKHSARYDFKRSFVRLIAPGIVSLLFLVIYFILGYIFYYYSCSNNFICRHLFA